MTTGSYGAPSLYPMTGARVVRCSLDEKSRIVRGY
jgi:hypothetical protein